MTLLDWVISIRETLGIVVDIAVIVGVVFMIWKLHAISRKLQK